MTEKERFLELSHCEDKTLRSSKWFWDHRAQQGMNDVSKGVFLNQNRNYVNKFERIQKDVIAEYVDRFEKFYQKKLDIIDVGCGYGRMSEFLSSLGNSYIGIDFCHTLIDRAKNEQPQYKYEEHDLREELPFGKKQFDIAIMISCITSVEKYFFKVLDNVRAISRVQLIVEEDWFMLHWPEEMISGEDKWKA